MSRESILRLPLRVAALLLRLNDRVLGRAVLVAAIAAVMVVAGWAFEVAGDAFGYHPDRNAAAWTDRDLRFDADRLCADCHAVAAVSVAGSEHVGVACQSCHGPLAAHAAAEPPSPVEATPEEAVDATCIACHAADTARPVLLAQVTPTEHFEAGSCADCHDAHTTDGVRPPEVRHPLARLPECLTCHSTLSFRPATAGHRASPDDVCLSCHRGELPDRLSGSLP